MTGDYRVRYFLMITRQVISMLAILVLTGCRSSDPTADLPLGEALQKTLDESITGSGAKGVSAAVIFSDGNMWTGASGISHDAVPVTTDMLFDIGSIGKNLEAALLLKLVEDGLLTLDDPLEKWFPPYPNIDGRITIRQLLGMTSGVDDFVDDAGSPWRIGYENIDFDRAWTWDEIYSSFVGEPRFAPGTKCQYSNTNYVILKHVIERVSQTKLPVELDRRILRPYGLSNMLVDFTRPIPDNLPVVHGWYDIHDNGNADDISDNSLAWLSTISPMLVYSTAGDLAKWTYALFQKKVVLKPESLEAMLSFHGPVMNEPMMNGYGLGVVDFDLGFLVPRWRKVRVYGHAGSQFGYSAFTGYFPELNITVSIMFNRGCDRETNAVTATVLDAFFSVLFRRLGMHGLNPPNSLSDLLDELQNSPGNVHLMRKIATMYRERGADDKALSMYERILKEDPDDMFGYRTNSLFWEASLTGSVKSYPDKLVSFIAEHRDYGDIQFAYKNLAETYKKRNEIAKAVTLYKEAVKELKGDAYFLNHVAWWIFENKVESEYAAAVEYAEEATALMPRECSIWDTRAQLYNVTGQHQKAVEASEKALSLAPEDRHKEYQEYLDKIRESN